MNLIDWNFIVWMLMVFGLANIIVFSSLLHPFRVWLTYSKKWNRKKRENVWVRRKFELPGKLIACIMCVGFWAGGFASLMFYSPTTSLAGDCFVGSAGCWLLYLMVAEKQNKVG